MTDKNLVWMMILLSLTVMEIFIFWIFKHLGETTGKKTLSFWISFGLGAMTLGAAISAVTLTITDSPDKFKNHPARIKGELGKRINWGTVDCYNTVNCSANYYISPSSTLLTKIKATRISPEWENCESDKCLFLIRGNYDRSLPLAFIIRLAEDKESYESVSAKIAKFWLAPENLKKGSDLLNKALPVSPVDESYPILPSTLKDGIFEYAAIHKHVLLEGNVNYLDLGILADGGNNVKVHILAISEMNSDDTMIEVEARTKKAEEISLTLLDLSKKSGEDAKKFINLFGKGPKK